MVGIRHFKFQRAYKFAQLINRLMLTCFIRAKMFTVITILSDLSHDMIPILLYRQTNFRICNLRVLKTPMRPFLNRILHYG